MKETKKMQIMPQDEERIINAYACFGWELTSSQEVKVKDSHLENQGGTIYNVTETENYVNLILARETSMPNYQALCKYQQAYESAQSRLRAKGKFSLIKLIIFPLLIFMIINNKKIEESNNQAFKEMDEALNKARALMG